MFISHDLRAVERLCDRALLMQRGEIVAVGLPGEMIAEYLRLGCNFAPSAPPGVQAAKLSKEVECTGLAFYDSKGNERSSFRTGESVTARLEYTARRPINDVVFGIFVYWSSGALCCQFTTHLNGRRIDLEAGTGAVEFCCGELGLQPGLYHLDVFVERFPQLIDWQHRCATLRVDPGKTVYGDFYMPHEWRLAHGNGLGGSAHIEEPADPAGEEESSA